jgi:hypothetical protein
MSSEMAERGSFGRSSLKSEARIQKNRSVPPSCESTLKLQPSRTAFGNRKMAIGNEFPTLVMKFIGPGRVSSKQRKINFGSNRNKPKQDLFRVCFGLFRETKN